MRAKAIRDLGQLSDRDFFAAVAEGLELVKQNVVRLEEAARALRDSRHSHGQRVLLYHAAEEAAKALILLDAVRCPRKPAEVLIRHLSGFNDHLAKGIYVECYRGVFGRFEAVAAAVTDLRQEFYLDGPNEVDWIYRNGILSERDNVLYVDYVAGDTGHSWVEPVDADWFMDVEEYSSPSVLRVMRALDGAGCFGETALKVIADVWRPITMDPDFCWRPSLQDLNGQTLEAMQSKGLLKEAHPETYTKVVEEWLYPLWSLELTPVIPVDTADLRAMQRAWVYQEMGVLNEYEP